MADRERIEYVRYYAPGSEALKVDPKPRRERTQPKPQVRQEPTVIPFDPVAVFGCVVAVALVVCVLFGFYRLNRMNNAIANAQNDLTTQKSLHYELETNYANGYDLEDIRAAAEAMGLVPMEQVQHITIRIPEPEPVEELPWWQEWWASLKAMFE
ncbi:MAG: hypothetical protein IJ960_07365 [Oscillospiraceae bacterium]|nr:hypothetical protein [Oscillospiraceae bacterium]